MGGGGGGGGGGWGGVAQGDWALSSTNFEVFGIFPSFLRS